MHLLKIFHLKRFTFQLPSFKTHVCVWLLVTENLIIIWEEYGSKISSVKMQLK
jgi:penicillin-binding protein-related factor A (putative recombinase)